VGAQWITALLRHHAPGAVWLALVSLIAVGCKRAPEPRQVAAGRLGEVRLYQPADTPAAFVFVFSDRDGWTPALDAVARRLAGAAAVVAGVDLPEYLKRLAASDDGCHYVVAELEDFSEREQRELAFAGYRSPIVAGIGAGGTLAYAALAQAPAATLGGAVSVDPTPELATRVPLCEGAPVSPAAGGGYRYGPRSNLPGWWRVSALAPVAPDLAAMIEKAGGELDTGAGPADGRLAKLLTAAVAGGGPPGDLPLVPMPAAQSGAMMAVIYSGDGGWRDIDKQIGEILVRRGVPVVGVDSLRYFWRARSPDEVARDLGAIITRYGAAWGRSKVLLIGYSFGAGVLPFAYNRLPESDRAQVVQISLLGLEPRAVFEIHLSGWLGVPPPLDGPPVLPELQRINLRLVQCFYGVEEEETLCRAPELAAAEIVRTPGGHHFDGNYAALAERILAGARTRLGGVP
jgi:type IV secretory pathway VirJ component